MMFETQEKLEEYFRKHDIEGHWINPDKYGFSRDYQFSCLGETYIVEWYTNLCTLISSNGNVHKWFTIIDDRNTYPMRDYWLNFKYGAKDEGLFLRYKETVYPENICKNCKHWNKSDEHPSVSGCYKCDKSEKYYRTDIDGCGEWEDEADN